MCLCMCQLRPCGSFFPKLYTYDYRIARCMGGSFTNERYARHSPILKANFPNGRAGLTDFLSPRYHSVSHTYTYIRTQTHTDIYTHTHKRARAHAHTGTRARALTHFLLVSYILHVLASSRNHALTLVFKIATILERFQNGNFDVFVDDEEDQNEEVVPDCVSKHSCSF